MSYGDDVIEIANVVVKGYIIHCQSNYDNGYLSFYFPIDSNK